MPHPQENARIVLVIILLFWVITSPDAGPGLIAAPSLTRARLARQRHAHHVLNSTSWGDFAPSPPAQAPGKETDTDTQTEPRYLNLTGFRAEDGLAWDDFGRFQLRCDEWSRNAVGRPEVAVPVWQNVTGVVRGPWIRKPASVQKGYAGYNLTEMTPDVDWLGLGAEWGRNVTGTEGTMMLRVEDDDGAATVPVKPGLGGLAPVDIKAREVSATVTIVDEEGSGNSYDMRLHGVHWPRQGALLLTTTSEKFAGIFGLPHLTTRPDFFASSQALLNRTLDAVLARKEKRSLSDPVNPWAANVDAPGESWSPSLHCEYILYLQVHPPDKEVLGGKPTLTGSENVAQTIAELEMELRFPQGAPMPGRPKLRMSAVAFSPDCGFFLETKGPPAYPEADGYHLEGSKQEHWLHDVSTWMLGFAGAIFLQIQLLKMQMRETSTPSTLGRISFYTASMMLLADGMTFAGSAAWSLSASTTLLPSLVVTVSCFLSTLIGVTFLIEIFKVQEPEWRRRERERQNTTAANTPRPPSTPAPTPAPASDGNTRQADARPPSPPFIIPSDQDIDAEIDEVTNNPSTTLPAPATAADPAAAGQNTGPTLSGLFGRFIFTGITVLFLSVAAISWRPHIRSVYFNSLAFLYLSFWVPQIYRNVYRNCRQALTWRFVVGQSCLRLAPISYFYVVKDNFAFATPDLTAFSVLAGWVWIQVWVLVFQNVLGPRFGIPRGWMPEAWEYHPVLREDNVEAGGLPIGLVSTLSSVPGSPSLERRDSSSDRKATRVHVIDCAICRDVLEVPVVKAGSEDPTAGGVTGVFARRAYMVTPCRHIFHSVCLESWMRFRLQCPICRDELPPL